MEEREPVEMSDLTRKLEEAQLELVLLDIKSIEEQDALIKSLSNQIAKYSATVRSQEGELVSFRASVSSNILFRKRVRDALGINTVVSDDEVITKISILFRRDFESRTFDFNNPYSLR